MRRVVTIFLLLIAIIAKAQEADKSEFRFGVYMRDESKKINSIAPSTVSETRANVTILGLEKPCVSLFIEKPYSKSYTKNKQPEFFFFFSNKENTRPITSAMIDIILKNYPFTYGKSPEEFTLLRLFKIKERRAMRLETEKMLSWKKLIPMDVDTIPFTSIPMPDNTYKIVLESKLVTGEYGFVYKGVTPYGQIIYDFSIEE